MEERMVGRAEEGAGGLDGRICTVMLAEQDILLHILQVVIWWQNEDQWLRVTGKQICPLFCIKEYRNKKLNSIQLKM